MRGVFTRTIWAVFFITALADFSHADGVSLSSWRGHTVLQLTGEISPGIERDLAAIIDKADVWEDGTRVLLLDSPGGDVEVALRISKLLDRNPTHTVVPNNASCASACGSIVFVAGTYRTVEPFGRIGQHSCSRGGQPDQACNDILAQHALNHGVSYGSVAAFVTYTPPQDVVWFSREDVDGWGLSRYPGEAESGFEKSEPRVIALLSGARPPTQSAWRLDFHGDGYRAFHRPAADDLREMQLNLFCYETLPGRLFLSMEINASVDLLRNAITKVAVATDGGSWEINRPITFQADLQVSTVVVEIPPELIRPFLTKSERLVFEIGLRQPYVPMVASTFLARSRKNLLFAANNCSTGDYDLAGQPNRKEP